VVGLPDALVEEILWEMEKQGIPTINELGRIVGWYAQYIYDRLGNGNPRTKRRVVLTIRDLEQLAAVLDTKASTLVARAEERLDSYV